MAYTAATPMAAGFTAVKAAFESVYTCLGITCEDVGGLLSGTGTEYFESAEPCVTQTAQPASDDSSDTPVGLIIGLTVCIVAVGCLCMATAYLFRAKNKAVGELTALKAGDKGEKLAPCEQHGVAVFNSDCLCRH